MCVAALTTCTIFNMPGNVLAYDGSNRILGWVVVVEVVTVVVVVCCPGKPWSMVSGYSKTVTQRQQHGIVVHDMPDVLAFASRVGSHATRSDTREDDGEILRKGASQVERSTEHRPCRANEGDEEKMDLKIKIHRRGGVCQTRALDLQTSSVPRRIREGT